MQLQSFALSWILLHLSVATVRTGSDSTQSSPPSAKLATRESVLDLLRSLPAKAEKRVLSGQFLGHTGKISLAQWESLREKFGHPFGPQFDAIHRQSGAWPAILGGDYYSTQPIAAAYETTNALFAEHSKRGGLVMLSLHMPNPQTGGNSWDREIRLRDLTDESTKAGQAWRRELLRIVQGLRDLEGRSIPVLLRPFHEMNGDWFWWGQGSDEEFRSLWKSMHRSLTLEHGLKNLIWVYAPNANIGRYLDRYPGSDVVDVVGLDFYGDDLSTMDRKGYEELVGTGKPFGFTEFGPHGPKEPIPEGYDYRRLIQAIQSRFPGTVFWQSWHGPWGMQSHAHADLLLKHPWVLNRGDL